jgi:hypothetical protein
VNINLANASEEVRDIHLHQPLGSGVCLGAARDAVAFFEGATRRVNLRSLENVLSYPALDGA